MPALMAVWIFEKNAKDDFELKGHEVRPQIHEIHLVLLG
jgi:hypothetical protein